MTKEEFNNTIMPMTDKLYRFANALLRIRADAEDVVQEVMLRLWSRRLTLGNYRSVDALAVVITKNLCLDRLKSKGFRHEELPGSACIVQQKDPHEAVELSDMQDTIRELIGRLPETTRMVIHLRDVEGYEFGEIAGMLGITENAVRVNLSRARKEIRKKLIRHYDYEYNEN